MNTEFKIGQEIKLACDCAGLVTYSKKKICEINDKGIYIDNGEGNKPSGPFHKTKLDLISLRGIGLGRQYICL